jgi:hypothetical protein
MQYGRVETDDGIVGAMMGSGNVGVSTVASTDDTPWVGIILCELPEQATIGSTVMEQVQTVGDIKDTITFLLFDKVESIDVVLRRLQYARNELVVRLNNLETHNGR